MTICDWPKAEKPREKLMTQGASALSDAELLALFIRTSVRGKTAVDVGRDLIKVFGGLRPLLDANLADISRIPGMGPAKAAQLLAIVELGRRHLQQTLATTDVLGSPQATRDYLAAQLRHREREVFYGLFVDSQNALIDSRELFLGTLAGAAVYPREVVKQALACNAASVIFAHNHPSGVAEPSDADIRITQRLKEALALVDINVLDHMVVGNGQVVSLAERGLI